MQAANKKVSLFKQKIKQARLAQENNSDATFPKPVKIDVKEIASISGQDQNAVKVQTISQTSSEVLNNIHIQDMLRQEIKEEDMKQISSENWNSINSMSEEEIKKYQQMIMSQIPSGFINKILKKRNQIISPPVEVEVPAQNEADGRAENQTINENKKKLEQTYHENKQLQSGKEKPDNKSKREVENVGNDVGDDMGKDDQMEDKYKPEDEQEVEEQQNSSLFVLQSIAFNITTKQLEFHHIDSPAKIKQLHTMFEIKTMLESENNQTQIVACNLLKEIMQKIGSMTAELPVVCISGVHVHYLVFLEQILAFIVPSQIYHIRKTKFRSCWTEQTLGLIQTFRILHQGFSKYRNWYPAQNSSIFLQWAKQLEQLKNSQWILEESNQSLSKLISDLITELSLPFSPPSPQQALINASARLEILIQVLYIEELQIFLAKSPNKYKFNSTISVLLSSLNGGMENDKLAVFFKLSVRFAQNQLKTNRTLTNDVKLLKVRIYQRISIHYNTESGFILPKVKDLEKTDRESQKQSYDNIFRKLFIMKTLCYEVYIQYLNVSMKAKDQENTIVQVNEEQCEQNGVEIDNDTVANMITLMNIFQYFAAPQPYERRQDFLKEVDNFQNMLQYVAGELQKQEENDGQGSIPLKEVLPLVFSDILVIFGSTEASNFETDNILKYQSLNEPILNSCVSKVCECLCKFQMLGKIWEISTHEQMKSLVQSYNFNSFGHYGFTRLMVFLLAASPSNQVSPHIENLILEETVCRYPFLFYYATENHEYYGTPELYSQNTPIRREWKEKRTILNILSTGNNKKMEESSNVFIRYLQTG